MKAAEICKVMKQELDAINPATLQDSSRRGLQTVRTAKKGDVVGCLLQRTVRRIDGAVTVSEDPDELARRLQCFLTVFPVCDEAMGPAVHETANAVHAAVNDVTSASDEYAGLEDEECAKTKKRRRAELKAAIAKTCKALDRFEAAITKWAKGR